MGPQPSRVRAALEHPLPASLPAGRATALFLYGHCFHPRLRVARLRLDVGGRRHRPDAARMPRPDLLAWLRSTGEDPAGRSYRSGFWATMAVPPQPAGGRLAVTAVAALEGGGEMTVPLGEVAIVDAGGGAPAAGLAPGTIAVCMATFQPDMALFAEQVRSVRDQTEERWVCVISDGGSDPARLAEMAAVLDGDPRFTVSAADGRLDPYRNFERALALAPADADLLALCDQDDRWYPDKLAALRAALGPAELVYSDQRLVTAGGEVLRASLWEGRRHDRGNLASLLVANAAPGAAMLMRRSLAERALPFPDAPGIPYHDHWLALVATCAGEPDYVDRPLYDYVQHGGAVQGSAAAVAGGAVPGSATGLAGATGGGGGGSRGWRAAYFGGYVPRRVFALALLARCGPLLSARRRRALALFCAADRSIVGFAWLALRPLRRLTGRDETLGGEAALAQGVTWRWLAAAAVAGRERPGRRPWDAGFPHPPRFEQRRLRRWRTGGR